MKILLLDIETAPMIVKVWRKYNIDYIPSDMVVRDWYILCWCAKWLGEKKMYSSALIDHELYKTEPTNDFVVVSDMWALLDEADIIITQNGDKFDIKKLNTRFIINGLTPPSPYRSVDTLKIAKRVFGFSSNKLNDLGVSLDVGKKMNTGGMKLWNQCEAGVVSAWKKMVKYCSQDVRLLEKIYNKFLPYIPNHPNLNIYIDDDNPKCKKCLSKKLVKEGYVYTNLGKYHRYSCKSCGSWARGKKNLLENKTEVR